MDKRALILFTKLPLAGKVKTRLMTHLPGTECAELQWALLRDLAPSLKGEDDLFVCYTPHRLEAERRLRTLLRPANFLPQWGSDLGKRMHRAFRQVFGQGYDSCLLLGSDIPFVGKEDIAQAWQILDTHDAVFGPSEDGGYWLVGLKKLFAPLFERRNYGHGAVLAQALAVCADHGLSAGMASAKRDLDVWEDLLHFRQVTTSENAPNLYGFLRRVPPAP